MLRWSLVLSHWIRKVISEGKDSVWIAQQEGRAKDGNDNTHPGVLKMLALSGSGSFLGNLRDLHIVPVAISYEFDPSDAEKAREVFQRKTTGTYQKAPADDIGAMLRGLKLNKGLVHIAVGVEISEILDQAQTILPKAEQVRFVAEKIDEKIHGLYRNWPSNYIAADILRGSSAGSAYYTSEEKARFLSYMEKRIAGLGLNASEVEGVRREFLSMYAASVR